MTAVERSPGGERSPSRDFGSFDGRVWLNAAHQGPLPRAAVEAGQRALAEKAAPHRLTDDAFIDVPRRLRAGLARFVGGATDEIVIGNSASYGLDLLARGLSWRAGDEVLLPDGEFPASVFPWRVIERVGVKVRLLPLETPGIIEPEELARQLTERTRVFCASWVNSFTGRAIDVDALGRVCRGAGVTFVLNASQALGARALDVSATAVDAVTCCGYKWLLGPYGTGFCWIKAALRESLAPPHAYWLPHVWGEPRGLRQYALRSGLGAEAYDVFCPASFLNVVPWTASVEYLLSVGPAAVESYTQTLVERLVTHLDPERYSLVSPAAGPSRSTLVVLRPKGGATADSIHATLTAEGVDTALREGAVRISPHLYNTLGDIDRGVAALRATGT